MTENRQNVKAAIRALLSSQESVANREVVRVTGLTRQAIHFHLRQMVRAGEILRSGSGRGARYRRRVSFVREYATQGLEEHLVWEEVVRTVPAVQTLRDNVRSILQYALTEMVNNAIEHSGSSGVRVSVWQTDSTIAFEVVDGGVGAFAHVRARLELPDDFAALQEISKGKVTTMPEGHAGEGIFFTSKAVDVFVLESGRLRWVVDNVRRDEAAGDVPVERSGTLVRWEIDQDADRELRELFDAYTDRETLAFSRSRVVVHLFERGARFISRSEAKRLTSGLERFSEVVVDFSGVTEVGQGFVDELFRVWDGQRPGSKLVPVNASRAVEAMIRRGLGPGTPASS